MTKKHTFNFIFKNELTNFNLVKTGKDPNFSLIILNAPSNLRAMLLMN